MEKTRGRPRGFDPETALEAVVRVFWKFGYEGASINDLVAATGMNKPSLYSAFGDKESLFLKALESYADKVVAAQRTLLDSEPEIWKALESLLRNCAAMLTDPALPGGCLVVTGMGDCGTPSMPRQAEAALRRALEATEGVVRERLERAASEGVLPTGTSCEGLASMVASLMAGMGIQAKAGADQEALSKAVDAVVALWPRGTARRRR